MNYLVAIFFLLAHAVATANTLASPEQIRLVTERTMAAFSAGNLRDGWSILKPYSTTPGAEYDASTGQFTSNYPMLIERQGKSLGHEFIREEKIGDLLTQITYAQKLERNVLRYKFIFYNSGNGWNLISWNIDDNSQLFFSK